MKRVPKTHPGTTGPENVAQPCQDLTGTGSNPKARQNRKAPPERDNPDNAEGTFSERPPEEAGYSNPRFTAAATHGGKRANRRVRIRDEAVDRYNEHARQTVQDEDVAKLTHDGWQTLYGNETPGGAAPPGAAGRGVGWYHERHGWAYTQYVRRGDKVNGALGWFSIAHDSLIPNGPHPTIWDAIAELGREAAA